MWRRANSHTDANTIAFTLSVTFANARSANGGFGLACCRIDRWRHVDNDHRHGFPVRRYRLAGRHFRLERVGS